jgi:hypothetical protein
MKQRETVAVELVVDLQVANMDERHRSDPKAAR